MKCPLCRQGQLYAAYRTMPVYPPLDSHRPIRDVRELADIRCNHCQSSWYALQGETFQQACRRIEKEEPRS